MHRVLVALPLMACSPLAGCRVHVEVDEGEGAEAKAPAADVEVGEGAGGGAKAPTRDPHLLGLTFVVDKEFDKQMVFAMPRCRDPAGVFSRARSMGISADFVRLVREADNRAEVEHDLDRLVNGRYKLAGSRIEAGQRQYTALWRTLLPDFSKVATEVTGHDWPYDEYVCVVSAFHRGLSNWYGNKIAARYDLPPGQKRRIVAHEILLSHVFHLARRYYSPEELNDRRIWAFSEVSAVFVLDDPRLRRFWPQTRLGGDWFARSNYPQLASLEKELKRIWDARGSFKDYLDTSVAVLRRFERTHCEEPGGSSWWRRPPAAPGSGGDALGTLTLAVGGT